MARQSTDKQFVELLTSSQIRLGAYALSLVRSHTDADDVLQNASIALWEKRAEYDADREFFPWACGVVLIEVLRYRDKTKREKLLFDDGLINTLATEHVARADELDLRRQLLSLCIAKLSESDRRLLQDRYGSDVKLKKISQQRGWSLPSVYNALSRIRSALHRCIETNLAQKSHS